MINNQITLLSKLYCFVKTSNQGYLHSQKYLQKAESERLKMDNMIEYSKSFPSLSCAGNLGVGGIKKYRS